MGFFDLNIPYHESDKQITDKSTKKTNRLKLLLRSMELGYSGVAYNRTMKGVMSESERCDTSLFPLSSILKLAPSISIAVKFHRELLGVPASAPFRQYTRLTVVVDSPSQASALNSGNPILKSYDIVAVRPLNQNAFEQACQTSEVDLIAIDFSEKLPFRLKQSAVKAAIQRGIYFEITYTSLLVDPQVRRQMITNAKLLVDWTRGKNLIFSSAAPSVTELRGPNDLANLTCLLGLSIERAKASISKNCRSLLANALRKKHFYKDAIRVEIMPSGKEIDPMGPGLSDWLKWDPISSGEGDLQLDDIEKAFRDSNKTSNTVKAIDFTSAVNSLPPYGLQIKDLIPTTLEQEFQKDPEISCSTEKILKAIDFASALNSLPPYGLQIKDLINTTLEQESQKDPEILCSSTEKFLTNNDEPLILDGLFVKTEENDLKSRICVTNYGSDLMIEDENESIGAVLLDTKIPEISMQSEEDSNMINILSSVDEQNGGTHKEVALFDDNVTTHVSVKDTEIGSACNVVASTVNPAPCSDDFIVDTKKLKRSILDVILDGQNDAVDEVALFDDNVTTHVPVKDTEIGSACNVVASTVNPAPCSDDFIDTEKLKRSILDIILDAQNDAVDEVEIDEKGKFEDIPESSFSKSFVADRSNSNPSVANTEPLEEVAVENKAQTGGHTLLNSSISHASMSGKARKKRKTSHGVALFPFKRFLSSNTLRRKVRKFKQK